MEQMNLVMSMNIQGFRGLDLQNAERHAEKLTPHVRVREVETVVGE
jgi:hypothetical protein